MANFYIDCVTRKMLISVARHIKQKKNILNESKVPYSLFVIFGACYYIKKYKKSRHVYSNNLV